MPLFAALIAIWGIVSQRAIARRRATLDHMTQVDTDNDMINAMQIFIREHRKPGGLAKWAEDAQEASDEAAAIRLVLNDFELVSVSIQYGIMDFNFYKQYSHGTVKRYWGAAAPFIHALRERKKRPTLFHEFEQLACWLDKGLRPPKKNLWFRKHVG